jgi:hypothetical protein
LRDVAAGTSFSFKKKDKSLSEALLKDGDRYERINNRGAAMKNKERIVQIVCCLVLVFSLILPVSVAGAWIGSVQVKDERSIIYVPADNPGAVSVTKLNMPDGDPTPMVAAGHCHTVGLKSDGTVVAVGSNSSGECNVGSWTGIVQVAAAYWYTVGLMSDGTLVAVGDNFYDQCEVDGQEGIVQVAAGGFHMVGLKSNGTVVVIGSHSYGESFVSNWTGIVQVAAGDWHTVGLKSDGTVVAVGSNVAGECNVGGWTNITQIAANYYHTVGLMSNGTVVAVGDNTYHQCSVTGWKNLNITQVAAGDWHTVGLMSNGTVVAVGSNVYGQCNVGNWTGIVQVAAGHKYTVGLKSDGTLIWTGDNICGQCNLFHWNLSGGPVPNIPPNAPGSPYPANNATGILKNACLSWSGGDSDGDTVTYDVYFGNSSTPLLVSSNQSGTAYCPPGNLTDSTKYYWQIIANDNYGGSTTGPLWNFTTNDPPNMPDIPYPADNATCVSRNTCLNWTGGDPDTGDNVTYDVYFGNSSTPSLVSHNQLGTTYCPPGNLTDSTKYYWKIVATDNHGGSTTGLLWDFTTNDPPNTPDSPSPADNATCVSRNTCLSWSGGDPDAGDPVTYDVYFGTNSTPPLVSSNQSGTTYCPPGNLTDSTKYYWKIVAMDNHGRSTTGPLWNFTTNDPPNQPNSPSPADNATGVLINACLSWSGGDPDVGDNVTYDVYFGTNSTPSLVSHNQSGTTYCPPGNLTDSIKYYWQIVAMDNHGRSTTGPLWNFTTDDPPYTPNNLYPADNATDVSISACLNWIGGDPDVGDTVTYDVYLGTNSTPPLFSSNQSGTTYCPGTLASNTTYYWKIIATDNHGASTAGPVWNFTTTTAVAQIVGETRAVNCDILPGVNITLYQGAVAMTSTVSNGTGNYELAVPAFGNYNVTASKAGFRNVTQAISVNEPTTYTRDFVGDYGLIPNAIDLPYVLACINKWVAGTAPCTLNLPKVLAVINAWVFPI